MGPYRKSRLDVLDAQRQLFDAEIELARTNRDQLVALVQIYKALGGGWPPEQVSGMIGGMLGMVGGMMQQMSAMIE